VQGETFTGAEIVERVAVELSVNPRLLLALLEFRSGWVMGSPSTDDASHPLGLYVPGNSGLYRELSIAATQLNVGYYGWRQGKLTELKFQDGTVARIAPQLNTGSAALQHLFSKLYKPGPWREALYEPGDFLALYQEMFGDPWARAAQVEPLFGWDRAAAARAAISPRELGSRVGAYILNTGAPLGGRLFSGYWGRRLSSSGGCRPGGHRRRQRRRHRWMDGQGTGWTLRALRAGSGGAWHAGEGDDPSGIILRKASPGFVHIARKFNGNGCLHQGPPFV
jgi:hypothetical protein